MNESLLNSMRFEEGARIPANAEPLILTEQDGFGIAGKKKAEYH
jgi:hypothetical protein